MLAIQLNFILTKSKNKTYFIIHNILLALLYSQQGDLLL